MGWVQVVRMPWHRVRKLLSMASNVLLLDKNFDHTLKHLTTAIMMMLMEMMWMIRI